MILPGKAVIMFDRDEINDYTNNNQCTVITQYITCTKIYTLYKTEYKGQELCICQAPLGAPAAAQLLEFLIGNGVHDIVAIGAVGDLVGIRDKAVLIPVEAIRDEGTSYQYLPPSRVIKLNNKVIEAIIMAMNEYHIGYNLCKTWTLDGYYRSTPEMVKYRVSEGCQTVEMECSGLAACAEFRKINFGQIFIVEDTLADPDNYDIRSWGSSNIPIALKLGMESVINIKNN